MSDFLLGLERRWRLRLFNNDPRKHGHLVNVWSKNSDVMETVKVPFDPFTGDEETRFTREMQEFLEGKPTAIFVSGFNGGDFRPGYTVSIYFFEKEDAMWAKLLYGDEE